MIRRDPSGNETVVARSVLSYDLCQEGGVVYTNGSKVFHLNNEGHSTEIAKGKLIEHVAALL